MTLVVKQQGRAMKAIKKTSAKDKKKDNNQECARVQSRNRRVSEVG